ncbi:MAG: hypothetical protein R3B68_02770 [Phycisphaerales bacterium]
MSDPDPLLAAVLAERHVACPECAYDLIGVGDGVCPECGVGLRIEIGTGRRSLDRIGAALLGSAIGMLAVGFGVLAAVIGVRGWVGAFLGGLFVFGAIAGLRAAMPNGRTWARLERSAWLACVGWWAIGVPIMLIALLELVSAL